MSLRSKRFANVSTVAQTFGGGGHVRAAGCSLTGTPEEILDKISEQLALQINMNEAE